MADLIKFRRRRSGSSANPIPQAGEPIYDLGSKKLYVGDGSTSLNALKPIGEQTTVENANNAVNVTTSIGGKSLSSIFESNGTVVKNATNAANATTASSAVNVTTSINGKAITSIFEANGTTAKNATTASKVGSSTVGGIDTPVYINNGTPTACAMSSLSVGSATKATRDSNGNIISSTYASTIDATYADSTLTLKLKNPGGTEISSEAVTISMSGTVDNANKLNNKEASYYRNATNINAGTLNFSRLPPLYIGDKQVSSSSQSDTFKVVTYTGSSAIGSATKPVYMNSNGKITASSASVGSATQPVYMSSGTITKGTLYAGGTNLTVNNTPYSGNSISIYAPTNAIVSSTLKRYLLGSSETNSCATVNTNSSVYMQNGAIFASGGINGVKIQKDPNLTNDPTLVSRGSGIIVFVPSDYVSSGKPVTINSVGEVRALSTISGLTSIGGNTISGTDIGCTKLSATNINIPMSSSQLGASFYRLFLKDNRLYIRNQSNPQNSYLVLLSSIDGTNL